MTHNKITTEPPLPVLISSPLPAPSSAPDLRMYQVARDTAFLVMALSAVFIAMLAVDFLQIAVRLGIGNIWRNIYVQYSVYVALATPIYLIVAQWQRQPTRTRLLRAAYDLASIVLLAKGLSLFSGVQIGVSFFVLNFISGTLGVLLSFRTVPPAKGDTATI